MHKALPIQLVTFDLDGTMLEDEWAHGEANRQIGRRLGIDYSQMSGMTGYSVRGKWEILCRQAGCGADIEEIAREHFRLTLEIVREAKVPESPGLTETLQQLRSAGYRIAVTSSSDESFVRAILDYLQVGRYLDFLLSKDQVRELKPSPEIYLTALRTAGVTARQAVGVEDSEPGCLALRRAGIYSIGFLNEGANHQNLEAADTKIQRMQDLLPLLEQMQA